MGSRLLCCLLVLALMAGCRKERPPRVPGAELQVLAERVAISKLKKPEDILPYDDALVWHEYKVKRVYYGECKEEKVRVAHWCVAGSKAVTVEETLGQEVTLSLRPYDENPGLEDVAQSDDLDIAEAPPRFIDLEQTLSVPATPDAMRMDYSGFFSEQMTLYWKLRSQLRLVAMGNSLVTKGLATRMFFPPHNRGTPMALNLAPAGANNAMQCLIVREYVLPLPKLEWVVWGVSPRSFNAKREDDRKLSEFLASPGWSFDQEHKATLWPAPVEPTPVTVDVLKTLDVHNFDHWGWEGRKRGGMPDTNESAKLQSFVNEHFKVADFTWSEEKWREFVETVKSLNARGVKVLLISTPMHPLVKNAPAADPDWTSHEGMATMVKRLEELDRELPMSWYQDFNKDGQHDYTNEEFYDGDHVNRAGSFKMTQRIIDWMGTLEAKGGQ